ncbi:MAG: alpha/beta hydrolase [Nitrososphaera sp.]
MGFSWDSNTTITPNGIGWSIAKAIAENNGPKLAHFMLDYKITCPDTDIRVIAHSLGTKVILNALLELTNNPLWNSSSSSSNFKIESVHLMGAAVDNEQVSIGPVDTDYPREIICGRRIESQVSKFYNFFDRQDNALEELYPYYEDGETTLGLRGAKQGITLPSNYQDIDVTEEVSFIDDANGDYMCDLPNPFIPNFCTISAIGDNHLVYVGYVSSMSGLSFRRWRNEYRG